MRRPSKQINKRCNCNTHPANKEIIMHNLKILVFALLLISLAAAPAYAKHRGCDGSFDHGGKGSGHFEQVKQALDLTSQQEADFKRILTASEEETASLREESKANRETIRSLFEAEVLDEPRLRELTSEQAKLHVDMMIAKHATREKVDQILSPEQQKKRAEFRQQRMKKKGHRRCEEPGAGKAADM
jgi:Spy/CpxP family protein refolding chaperone